jgi:hypothetical protein
MMDQTQGFPSRRVLANHADRKADLLNSSPEFADDALLELAYTISEYAIDFVGPFFWVCLVWLFLVAELGNSSGAI